MPKMTRTGIVNLSGSTGGDRLKSLNVRRLGHKVFGGSLAEFFVARCPYAITGPSRAVRTGDGLRLIFRPFDRSPAGPSSAVFTQPVASHRCTPPRATCWGNCSSPPLNRANKEEPWQSILTTKFRIPNTRMASPIRECWNSCPRCLACSQHPSIRHAFWNWDALLEPTCCPWLKSSRLVVSWG